MRAIIFKPSEDQARLSFIIPITAVQWKKRVKAIPFSQFHPQKLCWSIPNNRASKKQLLSIINKHFIVKERRTEFTDNLWNRLHSFENYLREKRYSRSTIDTYTSMVKQFYSRHPGLVWNAVTTQHIIDYNLSVFIHKKRSASAQNQFISAFKLFCTQNQIGNIIPDEIQRPRKSNYLPNVLTKDEVKRILLAPSNIKHRCMLTIIYGAGLRIGETLKLQLEDIRIEERLIYIRSGKGRQDRRVPLSETMIKTFSAYRAACQPKLFVFEGKTGGRYSNSSAQSILRAACRKAGIQGRITLHSLRHSYATHLLESGVSLRYIQEILGHNNPKTTMIYTHVSGKRLNEVRSPLEDLDL